MEAHNENDPILSLHHLDGTRNGPAIEYFHGEQATHDDELMAPVYHRVR
jgi:hypothetical protein